MRIPAITTEMAQLGRIPMPWLLLLAMPILTTGAYCALTSLCTASGDHSRLAYSFGNWLTLAVLALVMKSKEVPLSALGWRWPQAKDWAWAISAFLVGVFVVYPLAQAINSMLGTPMAQRMQISSQTPVGLAVQGFYAVVTAPFVEETLFRGCGMGYLRALEFHPVTAGLVQVVAFSAIHLPGFGIGGAIFILLWGLLPTALVMIRGNLAAAWLMHVLNNVAAYFVFPLLFP